MRARPPQIMAAFREQYPSLTVADAWQAYRELRDALAERDEKPSFAAMDRHPRIVGRVARDILTPEEATEWEITYEIETS